MAKMRNIRKLTTLLCLVLCLCLGLAACGGQGGEETTESTQPSNGTVTYTVKVSTVSGVLPEDLMLYVYVGAADGELETAKPLGDSGSVSFEADSANTYVAVLEGVPVGYDLQASYTLVPGENEILLTPGVITDQEKPADLTYSLGDVMYDFTVTDSNGVSHTLSQLLQEKDAVVLNFWFLNCGPCKLEFPYLELAYGEYSDSVEVLAINCEDGSDAELNTFAQEYDLSFPLAIGDKDYWCPAAYNACPTTIVIDRYGTIVYMHTGYFDEVAPFIAMFRTVTGEEYTQTLIEDIETVITDADIRPDGTKENPFTLGGSLAFDAKVPANGEVYYDLYRLTNVTMHIEDTDIYVIVDGIRYYPTNGVIELKVSCEDTMTPVSVAIGNTSGSRKNVHVEFIFEPGNVNNPIELVIGENEVLIEDVNGLGDYYTYTAANAGTLCITVTDCTDMAVANIQLYNENTFEAVYDGVEDPATGQISYYIHVNEGDKVQIIIGAATVDPEIILSSVTIKALASILEDGGSGVIDGKVDYTAVIVDQEGEPVEGAALSLSSMGTVLTSDSDGRVEARLIEGTYVLELAVPDGYLADADYYLWSPAIKELQIRIFESTIYNIQVQTQFGETQSNVLVRVYADEALENQLFLLTTNNNGMVSFRGKVGGVYYLVLSEYDDTLTGEEYYVVDEENAVLTLTEASSAPSYDLSETVQNFTITDIDGLAYSLQGLLRQKDAVIITFWRTGSTEATQALLALQQLQNAYGDSVAILALNPVDTLESEMKIYQSLYELTYPLAACDKSLADAMGVSNFPTTVVIDREGRLCLRHTGALSVEELNAVAQVYTAADYSHVSFQSIQVLLDYLAGTQTQDPALPPEDSEDGDESES